MEKAPMFISEMYWQNLSFIAKKREREREREIKMRLELIFNFK
jgi:hypothetical protein